MKNNDTNDTNDSKPYKTITYAESIGFVCIVSTSNILNYPTPLTLFILICSKSNVFMVFKTFYSMFK